MKFIPSVSAKIEKTLAITLILCAQCIYLIYMFILQGVINKLTAQ